MARWPGDPECIEMMQAIDAMPAPFRALVHEYGGGIVRALRNDGCHDAMMAEAQLRTWRARKQQQWLTTDFITPRTRQSFKV